MCLTESREVNIMNARVTGPDYDTRYARHLPRPKIDERMYDKQSLRWARHFLVSSIYSDLTDAMEHAKKLERMYDKQQRAEWYEPSNVE